MNFGFSFFLLNTDFRRDVRFLKSLVFVNENVYGAPVFLVFCLTVVLKTFDTLPT